MTTGIEKSRINMYEVLLCITNAGDLISPEVSNHHQQAAYFAYMLADRMGIAQKQKKDLVLAGLLHDVAAFSLSERLELIEAEPVTAHSHAFRGASLLSGFAPLENAACIIRHHHVPWDHGNGQTFRGIKVSPLSHILHLADRVVVQANKNADIITQVSAIRKSIVEQSGSNFMPEAVQAFEELCGIESIWLDVAYKPLMYILPGIVAFDMMELNWEETEGLTRLFSGIIDFRSPFTANHSAGVAASAEKIAEIAGFSISEQKMMHIAGNLHDIGKIAVSKGVLEKPGSLSKEELVTMRSHTFYTYRLLQAIKGFEVVNKWAAFHHETLDGKGYPFHLQGDSLPLGSRIMAVADVFTAISEDRPYRKGMEYEEIIRVLKKMVQDEKLCPYAAALLLDHYDEVNDARIEAQNEAKTRYETMLREG